MKLRTMFSIFALLLAGTITESSAGAQEHDLLIVDGHNDLFVLYMDCKICPLAFRFTRSDLKSG